MAACATAAIASACAYSSPVVAGSTVPAAQRTASVDETDVRRLLSALADDSIEGRKVGTRGEKRAAGVIAREMQAIGLVASGDSGYFQRVPLRGITGRRGQPAFALAGSWTELDTVPAERRGLGLNVIGILSGSDPALRDDIVLIGAHYDHVGIGAPVNGDSIFNGADDDASGVVTMLEIARAMSRGPAPRRTVIFMASTGEEAGLLGTSWYIRNPVRPVSRMVANMDIEMVGRPDSLAGGPGRAWLTGYERSTMGDMLKAANIPIVPDPRPDQRFFERSDNIAFARMGIPAHTLSSFGMHTDHHAPSDEVDRIDFSHMTSVISAAITAARFLADGPAPVWKEGGRPPAR